MTVIIVGAGIGGLTLGLSLHQVGIPCRIYEAAPEIKPLGVGLNLLPHAMRELGELGLEAEIARVAIETAEVGFYNRFGQHVFTEPRGRFAGYDWPQFSIHRGDLQMLLLEEARQRLGADSIVLGHRFLAAEQDGTGVVARFAEAETERALAPVRGEVLIGCDGIRSALRAQLYSAGDPLVYSGATMWRGVTCWPAFLSGASMVYVGWYATGKLVIYPIRDAIDAAGRQLVNWLVEFEVAPRHEGGDWSQEGRLEDFFWACEAMHFDWLDIPAMVQAAEFVLEYPMVDKEPLPRWSFDRRTLLGDAAHPMYPRGSNGAGQAILDARTLAGHLKRHADPVAALKAYEDDRLRTTADVVRANRTNPPDAILREVYERTGDKPFRRIEDVMSLEELTALSEGYKTIAGFEKAQLSRRRSLV